MEKKEKVHGIFERIAKNYDDANDRISLGMQKKWKNILIEDVVSKVEHDEKILDVCCGTCDIGIGIAKKRKDLYIIGLDFSKSMLEIAMKKATNLKNIQLVSEDCKNLPFENEQFKASIISFGLRNTDDYNAVISEMARVTKKDGYLYVMDSFLVENKIILPFYTLFFRFIMPIIGGGFKRYKDYKWLYESTKNFVKVKDIIDIYQSVNINNIAVKKLLFGSSVIIRGQKY